MKKQILAILLVVTMVLSALALAGCGGSRGKVTYEVPEVGYDGSEVTIHRLDGDGARSQRTAIGQRADGTIILLVTDGRTTSNPGATYNDVTEIMVKFGAVTAGMLDGGSSAMMYYRDWYEKYEVDISTLDANQRKGMVNKFKAFTPPRYIPTYFMVREEGAS